MVQLCTVALNGSNDLGLGAVEGSKLANDYAFV